MFTILLQIENEVSNKETNLNDPRRDLQFLENTSQVDFFSYNRLWIDGSLDSI